MRACRMSACAMVWFEALVTGGAVQTTAKTTPAGLTIARTKMIAKKMRTGRERSAAPSPPGLLLVGEVLEFRGQLAYPAAVVQAPDDCLLYTSDAADDLLCVDLGGR